MKISSRMAGRNNVTDFSPDMCIDHFWLQKWKVVKISQKKPDIAKIKWLSFFWNTVYIIIRYFSFKIIRRFDKYRCTYLSSFIAIWSGSVSPSSSTITGAHILHTQTHIVNFLLSLYNRLSHSWLFVCNSRFFHGHYKLDWSSTCLQSKPLWKPWCHASCLSGTQPILSKHRRHMISVLIST